MAVFVQQLPALIGVVIGALGSYVAVALGDRARFRREQASRWQDRRLTAYSDYARSVKTTVSALFRVAAHLGNDPHPHSLTPEDAAAQPASAYDSRDVAWRGVGDDAAARRAKRCGRGPRMFITVAAMERFLHDQLHDPDKWSSLLRASVSLARRFTTPRGATSHCRSATQADGTQTPTSQSQRSAPSGSRDRLRYTPVAASRRTHQAWCQGRAVPEPAGRGGSGRFLLGGSRGTVGGAAPRAGHRWR